MLIEYHTSNYRASNRHNYNDHMRNFYGYGANGEKQGAYGVRLASPDLTYTNKVTSTATFTEMVWWFLYD